MDHEHLVAVSRAARRMGNEFPGYLSTGEAVAAALVLNRADYLKAMDYTMAEAIHRLDGATLGILRDVQFQLQCEAPLAED